MHLSTLLESGSKKEKSKEMNSEAKELWLEGLRSDRYKQGKGCLLDSEGKFCCLGVLTDVYATKFNYKWNFADDGVASFSGESAILPVKVAKWAGVARNPHVEMMDGENTLTALNDSISNPFNFKEIAAVVDRQL